VARIAPVTAPESRFPDPTDPERYRGESNLNPPPIVDRSPRDVPAAGHPTADAGEVDD